MAALKRLIPLFILLALMLIVYLTGLHELLSYERLKAHREYLKGFVDSYPLTAPLAYIGVYALSTALSVPGGAVLSIFGGFLFPQPFSTLYVVTGATIGAIVVFLIAKTALGKFFKEKAGSKLEKMRKGFQEDAVNYLLFLRLVPVFPFWLVNIAPAFFGVPLWTYTWTTFAGIIPGAFVFTQAGVGLGAILDAGKKLTVGDIFNVQIRIALIALGIFALMPAVIKRFRKK